ncbi:MAG: hypothetical protein ACI4OB_04585, partial [Christensenellales bacterium]
RYGAILFYFGHLIIQLTIQINLSEEFSSQIMSNKHILFACPTVKPIKKRVLFTKKKNTLPPIQ